MSFPARENDVDLTYTSCTHETLPVWELDIELEGGSSLRLVERWRVELQLDFGPASLERAEVVLDGTRRDVTDYYDLVYSADRHNTHEEYWIVLDPPLSAPNLTAEPIHAIWIITPQPQENPPIEREVNLLGASFEVLRKVDVVAYGKELVDEPLFDRGDVNTDGGTNLSDAVAVLNYLFAGNGGGIPCEKAADANDDGGVNLSDAVAILDHLFRGTGPLPEPFGLCGADTTADDLTCDALDACN